MRIHRMTAIAEMATARYEEVSGKVPRSLTSRFHIFFFFFQAEDGIRDLIVTGVQTCALPILGADGTITSGILRGIEDGWFTAEIADSAFIYQQALERGTKKIVGVNAHTATVTRPLEILRISHEVELAQREVLARRRAGRDQAAVDASLKRMVEVARTDENLVPAMLDAARVEATLGEICDALRAEWGVYREPARF